MSLSMFNSSFVIVETTYPLYSVALLSDSHLIVAGGGGQSKTGVPNLVEIFYLDYVNESIVAIKTASFDTASLAVMNMDSNSKNNNELLVAVGKDKFCQLYSLAFNVSFLLDGHIFPWSLPGQHGNVSQPNGLPSHLNTLDHVRKAVGFDIIDSKQFQSDFDQKGSPYQKVVRIEADAKFLVTGGADGHWRVWELPSCKKFKDHNAHRDDIEDIAISPTGQRFITIGRDAKGFVWQLPQGSKVFELKSPQEVPDKFRFRTVRFTKLGRKGFHFFTSSIPVQRVGKKQQSFVTRWVMLEKECLPLITRSIPNEVISAMAVSDQGYLLSIGTLDGSVVIMDSLNLRIIKYFNQVHGIFVTGLQFLPTSPRIDSKLACLQPRYSCGVISISADNKVRINLVPRLKTRGFTFYIVAIAAVVTFVCIIFRFLEL